MVLTRHTGSLRPSLLPQSEGSNLRLSKTSKTEPYAHRERDHKERNRGHNTRQDTSGGIPPRLRVSGVDGTPRTFVELASEYSLGRGLGRSGDDFVTGSRWYFITNKIP